MLVAVVRVFRTFSGASAQALLLSMAVVFYVTMLIPFLIPDKEEGEELYKGCEGGDEDADGEDVGILDAGDDHAAFLKGFSVPPPPDTSLPPSSRAHRAVLTAQTTNMAGDSETGTATTVSPLESAGVEGNDPTGSANSTAPIESPDPASVTGITAPAGADAATVLPIFTLDLKADPVGGKGTNTAVGAPQEEKDD